jgi:hypothetical protein
MEFLVGNMINTTSMIQTPSGTLTIANLFNPDKTKQWVSSGYNSDIVATEITINFAQTVTVDRIALKEHNLKEFHCYHNALTANIFALTTANTSTLSYSANSDTAQFFNCTPVACTSVSLYMKKTQYADSEKAIGFLYVGAKLLDLPRVPSAKNYGITKRVVKITHTLSDGGTRVQKISEKWDATVKLSNLSYANVTGLEAVYNRKTPMCFAPLGTSTAWSGILFDCIWDGDFDFWEYSDNAVNAGFEGGMKLKETPW